MNTKNFLKIVYAAALLLLAVAACKKGNDPQPDPDPSEHTVYVAGYVYDGTKYVATLWINGEPQSLPADGSQDAFAHSVAVSGNDVYVAGYHDGNKQVAILWKNGVPQSLTDGSENAEAYSVAVSGSDVYVAGYERYSYLDGNMLVAQDEARLWKNGQALDLLPDYRQQLDLSHAYYTYAHSVAVSGNDVYLAGYGDYIDGAYPAMLWKNGLAADIANSGDPQAENRALSIAVSGSDVYAAGWLKSSAGWIARLWKNGVAQNLNDGSRKAEARSIAVSGSDVYVAGYEENDGGIPFATLWKNGVSQPITNSSKTYATSVAVSGNDVYVAGYEDTGSSDWEARLWKNGQIQPLTLPDGAQDSEAYSVFVVTP